MATSWPIRAGLKNTVDASLLPLVEECERRGVTIPDGPYELANAKGVVVAEADLAWPFEKIAVLNAERREDQAALQQAGWKVMTNLDRHDTIIEAVTCQSDPSEQTQD